jgi:hypothetical protein
MEYAEISSSISLLTRFCKQREILGVGFVSSTLQLISAPEGTTWRWAAMDCTVELW